MKYSELSNKSKEYINKYAETYHMTKEEALKSAIVRCVVNEYEGDKNVK